MDLLWRQEPCWILVLLPHSSLNTWLRAYASLAPVRTRESQELLVLFAILLNLKPRSLSCRPFPLLGSWSSQLSLFLESLVTYRSQAHSKMLFSQRRHNSMSTTSWIFGCVRIRSCLYLRLEARHHMMCPHLLSDGED